MSTELLTGADVVSDGGALPGGWLLVEDGRIAAVGPAGTPAPAADRVTELAGATLLPGFVDVHVHGGGGGTFGGDEESLLRAARFHARGGTTSLLGTLVTAPPDVLLDQVRRLSGQPERLEGGPRLLGLHLEGPFLAAARCGAHDPALLRAPTEAEVAALLDAGAGRVRVVTAAPELAGFDTLLRLAREAGVVVSAGHTDADGDRLVAAIAAGARSLTHTLNAMRPPHHRSPGPLAAVTDTEAFCEAIVDGAHLAPATVRVLRRLAGSDRLVLVTDAVPWAGLPEGEHRVGDRAVEVRDGAVRLAGTGTLAGSVLTMGEAVRRYAAYTGAGPAELARVSATNPARLLGVDDRVGRLRVGHAADAVALDADLCVSRVMVAGRWLGQTGS